MSKSAYWIDVSLAGIRLGTESEKKPGVAVVRSLRKLGASLGSQQSLLSDTNATVLIIRSGLFLINCIYSEHHFGLIVLFFEVCGAWPR